MAYPVAFAALVAATTFDPLLVYGPLGVFVVAFSMGLIVAKPIYDRALMDRDRAESQRDAVTQDVMDRVAPVLQKAIETIQTAEQRLNVRGDLETELRSTLVDVRRLLERER